MYDQSFLAVNVKPLVPHISLGPGVSFPVRCFDPTVMRQGEWLNTHILARYTYIFHWPRDCGRMPCVEWIKGLQGAVIQSDLQLPTPRLSYEEAVEHKLEV